MTQCKVWALGEFGAPTFKQVTPLHTLVPFPHRITGQEFPSLLPWPGTIPLLILVLYTAGKQQTAEQKQAS